MYAMNLSDWKGWSQDPPLPRPHLRVGSGGEGDLTGDPYLPKASSFSSFVSVSMTAAFRFALTCCSLELCHSAVTAVLSITL